MMAWNENVERFSSNPDKTILLINLPQNLHMAADKRKGMQQSSNPLKICYEICNKWPLIEWWYKLSVYAAISSPLPSAWGSCLSFPISSVPIRWAAISCNWFCRGHIRMTRAHTVESPSICQPSRCDFFYCGSPILLMFIMTGSNFLSLPAPCPFVMIQPCPITWMQILHTIGSHMCGVRDAMTFGQALENRLSGRTAAKKKKNSGE